MEVLCEWSARLELRAVCALVEPAFGWQWLDMLTKLLNFDSFRLSLTRK